VPAPKSKRKLAPSWLTADEELLGELQRQLDAGKLPIAKRLGINRTSLRAALKALLDGAAPAPSAETSVLASFVRPCVPFAQDTASRFWQRRLALAMGDLTQGSRAMARIRLNGDPKQRWAGTGWLAAERVLVTTRATAQTFNTARRRRGVRAEVQFESGTKAGIAQVLLDAETDLAFLVLESIGKMPSPVLLAADPPVEPYIAALGYPSKDARPYESASTLAYENVYDCLTVAPGRIRAGGEFLQHDCATLGNPVGALLLDLDSGKAAGLHLNGFLEGTAISAATIRAALRRHNLQPAKAQALESVEEDFLERVKLTPQDYDDRKGYDDRFLGLRVPLPKAVGTFKSDLAQYTGPNGKKTSSLPYMHFSVVMSQSRRLCLYTAVNIDGKQQKDLRRGEKADHWVFDPRLDQAAQCGRPIYRGGFLDLGHMVRRLDPVWGKDFRRANDDTFHFTNACPQHKDLNRKVWNDLEDYVLKATDQNRLKVTVFTGPVLAKNDPAYRGVKLPQQYWKVAVMRRRGSGKLHATAYILSQADMITGLEFAFGEFRTYQLPLAELERMVQLDFSRLRKFDPKSKDLGLESAAVRYTEISGPEDLVL
jgi:endonuclease G